MNAEAPRTCRRDRCLLRFGRAVGALQGSFDGCPGGLEKSRLRVGMFGVGLVQIRSKGRENLEVYNDLSPNQAVCMRYKKEF